MPSQEKYTSKSGKLRVWLSAIPARIEKRTRTVTPSISPMKGRKEVKVDITIEERLVLPLQERPVLRGYEEYDDLPDDATVQVYSLEEILVEKVVALTDLARNEPRDLYDVWFLTDRENMDIAELIPEITAKLEFRGRGLEGMGEEFGKKGARLKKLWQMRLANQMAELPHFEEVYRAVQRSFRGAGLA